MNAFISIDRDVHQNTIAIPIIVVILQLTGCSSESSSRSDFASAPLAPSAVFGDPLPGLSDDQRARFLAGRTKFETEEDAAEGLGPVFNDTSCANCHSAPAVGGGSARIETRFGTITNGVFDPLTQRGGSLIQDHGIGLAATCNFVAEAVPAEATIRAGRRTTALFGLGLVDAIPDATLIALAAKEKQRSPATAGTVSVVPNLVTGGTSVGKFGWKAQNPSLFQFSADAYLNEMGVTSPLFPNESCPQGDCALLVCNPAPGLNDDGGDVQAFTDFMSLLAPPPRAADASGDGESKFETIGCTDCHTPALKTGPSAIAALSNKEIHPYSDFLLHDMGALGDGIVQNQAQGAQMRTAPLWGLRATTVLLHDGRATTVAAAILAHDGQGKGARDRFAALNAQQQAKLLAFLGSL